MQRTAAASTASVRRVLLSVVHIGLTLLMQLTDIYGVHASLYCPDHFDRWAGTFTKPNHYLPSWHDMEHRIGYVYFPFSVDLLRYRLC